MNGVYFTDDEVKTLKMLIDSELAVFDVVQTDPNYTLNDIYIAALENLKNKISSNAVN